MNQTRNSRKITPIRINRSRSPSPVFASYVNVNNTPHMEYATTLPSLNKEYSIRTIDTPAQQAFMSRPSRMEEATNVVQHVNYIPPQLLVSNLRVRPTSVTIGKKSLPRYSKTSRNLLSKRKSSMRKTRKSRKSRRTRKNRN
jgi:hypothetical protein